MNICVLFLNLVAGFQLFTVEYDIGSEFVLSGL